jgi:DNA replication protein DnaC
MDKQTFINHINAVWDQKISSHEAVAAGEFFFQGAVEAFEDWSKATVDDALIRGWASVKPSIKEFKAAADASPDLGQVRDKIYRIAAYCDTHADRSAFPEIKAFARAGIRQNQWVQNLLKYRLGEPTAPGVSRALAYIQDPQNRFPILSQEHLWEIARNILGKPYNPAGFDGELLELLRGTKVKCQCADNLTYVYSRCLYELKSEWFRPEAAKVKGIVMRDGTILKEDSYAYELVSYCKRTGGPGILWWSPKPSAIDHYREYLDQRIAEDGYFPLYLICQSVTQFRGKVVDFAFKDDYPEKVDEWKEKDLGKEYVEAVFSDYASDSKSAEIVFLIEEFERLPEDQRIHADNFETYIYKPSQTNPVAYTAIKTQQYTMFSDYLEVLKADKNIILQGAPGTGKTWSASRLAVALIDDNPSAAEAPNFRERYQELKEQKRIQLVTFHQSYDYENFVEGIRTSTTESGALVYSIKPGVFKSICEDAKNNGGDRYVLIIDEINRGSVSRIFGELITLLEKDKRLKEANEETALLTYSGKPFGVPSNLFIIGTMNTTDRSTGVLDYALRRRFSFITIPSKPEVLDKIEDVDVRGKAQALYKSIKGFINSAGENAAEDLMVGHSYFLEKDLAGLKRRLVYGIIPLVREYVYDGILSVDNKKLEESIKEWKGILG